MYETETTRPIHDLALANTERLRVLAGGTHLQVELIAIPEGEETGAAHDERDRVLVVVAGEALAVIGETETHARAGDMSFVAAGTFHNFRNTGQGMLRLYAVCAPPEVAAT